MQTKFKVSDMTVKELQWRRGILTLVDESDPLLRRFGQLDFIKLSAGKTLEIEREQADEIWTAVSGSVEVALEDLRQDSPSYKAAERFLLDGEAPLALLVPFGVGCRIEAQTETELIRITTHKDRIDSEDVLLQAG